MTFYDQLEDWLNKTNYKAYISDKKASGARKEDYTDEESAVMKAMLYANNAIQRAKLGKSFDMNELLKNVRFIADRSQQDGFHYGGPNATAYGAWLNSTNKKSSADYDSMQKILGTKVSPEDIDNYDNLTLGQKVELMDKFGYDYNNSKSRSEFFKMISNRQRDKAIKEAWEPETNWYGVNKKTGEFQPLNWLQEMSMQYGPAKLMADYSKENWENISPDKSWQGGGMLGRGVAGVGINTVETLNPAKGFSTGGKVLMKPIENKAGQFVLGNALAPLSYATAEQLNSDEFDPRQFITDAAIGTAINAGAGKAVDKAGAILNRYDIPGISTIGKLTQEPYAAINEAKGKVAADINKPVVTEPMHMTNKEYIRIDKQFDESAIKAILDIKASNVSEEEKKIAIDNIRKARNNAKKEAAKRLPRINPDYRYMKSISEGGEPIVLTGDSENGWIYANKPAKSNEPQISLAEYKKSKAAYDAFNLSDDELVKKDLVGRKAANGDDSYQFTKENSPQYIPYIANDIRKRSIQSYNPLLISEYDTYLKTGGKAGVPYRIASDVGDYITNKAGEEKWGKGLLNLVGFDPSIYAKEKEKEKEYKKAKAMVDEAGIKIENEPEGLTYDEQIVFNLIQKKPQLLMGLGNAQEVARVREFLMKHPDYGRPNTLEVEE